MKIRECAWRRNSDNNWQNWKLRFVKGYTIISVEYTYINNDEEAKQQVILMRKEKLLCWI